MANLTKLDPRFHRLISRWLAVLRSVDPRFVVTSGFRTRAEQEELWAKWLRGDPSQKYRPLAPGLSQHERGFAVDIARFGHDPSSDELLAEAGAAWRGFGGVWGGPSDPVHFEAPRSLSGRR